MNPSRRAPRFELTPIARALRQAGLAAVTAAALAPFPAFAQVPTGGTVTRGAATIQNVSPTQQRITQTSDRAIINWQSFSIGQGNSVQFAQPGAGSVVLNRVTGANPSSIFGTLSANGQVFLVNPQGVYFSPTARVDVAGIVASTLNIRDNDFMLGNYSFFRDPLSPANARVVNEGSIVATPGGYVVLAGDYAANRGTIEARGGNVVLASGNRMTLDMRGDGLVSLAIDEKAVSVLAAVENAGQIIADGGRVVMTAAVARDLKGTVVNNTGLVQARGTVERDGAIYLTGSGGDVASSGRLDASGPRGGQVTVQSSGTTLVSGAVNASGSTATGGNVQILGERVGLIDNANVNASGTTGGGTVLVGGDFQGKNADVQNAQRTYVGPNAIITADAGQTGDGGKVIVWADGDTRYYGNISARGGAQSGNGGFSEVSGKQVLDFNGLVDLRAPAGRSGTLLLDPFNLSIQAAGTELIGGSGVNPFTYQSNANDSILLVATLQGQLAAANVIVQTGGTGVPLSQPGDLTVADKVTNPGTNSLTLRAHNDITLNAELDFTSGGNVSLVADTDATGGGRILGAGPIRMGAGSVSLTADNGITATTIANAVSFTNNSGAVSISNTKATGLTVSGTNSGTIAITETAGNLVVGAGNINSNNNTISLTASAGTINDTGTISGSTLTTSSKGGTTLNSANAVTGFNASNNTTGDISFSNDTATTLTVTGVNQTATAGAVSITHAGNVNITGTASTSDGAVSVTANGGSLTVGSAVTAGGTARDVTLTTTGNNDINVNAAVTAASDNITLNSGGAINGSGTLTSSGLALSTTTGSIGSSGTPLALSVDNFEGQAPGGIFVSNSKALTIGGVSAGLNGVTSTGLFGSVGITATALTINEAVTTVLGASPVTLSADQFAINTNVTGSIVTLAPKTAGTNFTLGLGATGAGLSQAELLNITAGTTRIGSSTSKAGTITFDGNLALTTTQGVLSLNSTGAVTQAGGTVISTPSGFAAQTNNASLTLNQPGNNFQTVAINAGTGSVDLRNDSNFTVATVDSIKGITAGNVTLTTGQTRTANVTATDTLDFGAPSGLVAGDRVRITGGGTDFVTTVQSAAGNTATISQNLTTINSVIDANTVTVASVAGLAVGDLVTIPGAGSGGGAFTSTIAAIDAGTLKVTLTTGAFTTVAAGTQVIRGRPSTVLANGVTVTRLPTTGTIASGSTSLTVASANGFSNGDRIVVGGAGPNGSDLLTTIAGIAGNVLTLANAAGTESKNGSIAKPSFIGNPSTTTAGIAGVGTTTVTVASTAGFRVGDAISIAGAGGSGAAHNVTITNVDGGLGTLTLSAATVTEVNNAVIAHTDQGIASTGTLTLQSNLPGGFTQAGGAVTATNLVLKGYGPFNLSGAGAGNKIDTLAADVTGSIAVGDRNAITIGSAGGINGVTTRSVLIVPAGVVTDATYTDANVTLSTNSDNAASGTMIQVNQPIVAGAKEPFPAADDPAAGAAAARTGQVLLFLVNDTKATGTALIEGGLLNLAAEVTKGTFDLTTKVSALALSGSKDATINNIAHTGNLSALNLGLRDISTSGTATSTDTTTAGAAKINTTGLVADAHAGRKLEITSGPGKGEVYSIVSNTATQIVLAGNFTTNPGAGATFKIGEDKDIRAGNVTLRTGGDIAVTAANVTGNLAVSAEKFDSRATFTLLASAGNNIFIQADRLLVTSALTTPGVNVLLRPFTTTNTVGIHGSTDSGMPHRTTTGSIDITVSAVTLNVASAAGFFVGDSITIVGADAGGANLVTTIASINGNALTLNDVAAASVTGSSVTNGSVDSGATNYSAATLRQFHAQSNITIGGDNVGFPPTFTTPIGIVGTPRLSGNVFIGSDGALDLGTRNLNVSTTGNISVANLGPVGNVGLVAGGAGGITLANLNSTGANLLFKANTLSMPGAASAYTTAAGVNVTLQPYTLTNSVGVHSLVDYFHTAAATGSATAGSPMIALTDITGSFVAGDTVDVFGAGPGGANILGATVYGSGAQIVLSAPAAVDAQNVTVITNLGITTTTGSIKAGSNILLVADASGFNAGQGITVNGAGTSGGQLNGLISSLGAANAILLGSTNASTTASGVRVGKPPAQAAFNTNYSLALLNNFNATAKITVSGTTTTPAGGNTLAGNIHIGADGVTGAPFDIGARTLTASTTGSVFNHSVVPVTTATSGTSGTVPPGAAWTAGQNPAPGTSTGGGPGGGGPSGPSGPGGPSGPTGPSGPGGPPSAGPGPTTTNPTDGGNPGPITPITPTPTPPGTTTGGPTTPNPIPPPNTTPGPGGTTVIGYTPDPDPVTPPVVVTPPGTPPDPPTVVVTPTDPGPPILPPGTPPDPPTVVVTPTDPGPPIVPPGTPIDPPTVIVTPTDPGPPVVPPGTPVDPPTVVVTPTDPGPPVTPPGTPVDPPTVVVTPTDPGPPVTPPGTPIDPPTVVVTPTDPGPPVTPPGTPIDPPTVVVTPTDPGPPVTPPGAPIDPPTVVVTPTDPVTPGVTPPGGTPPGTPLDPTVVVTGPTDPGTPGVTPPGGTPPGTPLDPTVVVTGPTDPGTPGVTPPGGTPPGTPLDPTVVVTGPTDPGTPGVTPPGGTPPGTPLDPTVVVTGPTDPGTPGVTPPGGTPPGTPVDPTVVVTGPTDPGTPGVTPPGGTPPGSPPDGTTPGSGPIATGPTDPGTPGGTPPGGTPPGSTPDGGTTPGSGTGPVAGGPGTPGGPGGAPGTGTTVTTTSPNGTTTTTTTVTSPDGTTTVTTSITSPDGMTTTTTATTGGTGTTTSTEIALAAPGAECPAGTAPSRTESGTGGSCVAVTSAQTGTAAAPVVAPRPTAAPNTQGAPAPVYETREHGVNLYQAGRRNGPGTPEPGSRR